MSTHASARQLELYVLGALELEGSERLEQHVRGCSTCAAALAAEARFEMALQELLPLREDTLIPPREGVVVTLPARMAPREAPRRTYSAAFAAAIALVVGLWGVEVTRLDANYPTPPALAEPAQSLVLACELSAEEPMCASPAAVRDAFAEPLVTPSVGICTAPAGGTCRIQSRSP